MNNLRFTVYGVKFSHSLLKNSHRPSDNLRNFYKSLSLAKNLAKNPYLEKYADKIAEAQKLSSKDLKNSHHGTLRSTDINPSNSKSNLETKQSVNKKHFSCFQKQKNLNQVMKLDAIHEKSAQEIEKIWKEYHKVKDGVYAVLPTKPFNKIHKNLKNFPVFLFPLPRAQGYEFIMCQFFDQSCYFTSLVNYQAFKENAPVCLTLTYFTELMDDKGIILMRGEYDDSLKVHEAQCLANQLQLYYGGQEEEKSNLLWKFNCQPNTFKHTDLIFNFESAFNTAAINYQ